MKTNKQVQVLYIYIPEFKTENKKKLKQKRFLSWKGKIYIYCRISCTINGFIIIIVNLSVTLFNILFCVDTKIVLYLLPSTDSEVRFDIAFVIKYLVHCLLVKRYRCHFLLDSFNLWTNL